jgi:hypothetical protein
MLRRLGAIRVLATGLVVVTGLATSEAALAATVEVVRDEVSVNRSRGFRPVAGATEVQPGHQVMAGSGGHGRIIYEDGCVVDVYPGDVVTVEDRDPKSLPGECRRAARFHRAYLLAIPVAVGLCIAFCFEDDDDRPRSP